MILTREISFGEVRATLTSRAIAGGTIFMILAF